MLPFELSDDDMAKYERQLWSLKRYAHSSYSIKSDMQIANTIIGNIKKSGRFDNLLAYVAQQFKKFRVKTLADYAVAKMAKMAPIEEKRNVNSFDQYIKKGRI